MQHPFSLNMVAGVSKILEQGRVSWKPLEAPSKYAGPFVDYTGLGPCGPYPILGYCPWVQTTEPTSSNGEPPVSLTPSGSGTQGGNGESATGTHGPKLAGAGGTSKIETSLDPTLELGSVSAQAFRKEGLTPRTGNMHSFDPFCKEEEARVTKHIFGPNSWDGPGPGGLGKSTTGGCSGNMELLCDPPPLDSGGVVSAAGPANKPRLYGSGDEESKASPVLPEGPGRLTPATKTRRKEEGVPEPGWWFRGFGGRGPRRT